MELFLSKRVLMTPTTYEKMPQDIMSAKIPKIFSSFVNGYMSPYPVLDTVVRAQLAEAI